MIGRTLENLMQRLMKVSFSSTQPLARHIESSTREKKKKTVMESINVAIDDAITNVTLTVEIEDQGVEVE